jgi:hypothetical protein
MVSRPGAGGENFVDEWGDIVEMLVAVREGL